MKTSRGFAPACKPINSAPSTAGDNYDWDYFALYMEPNGEAVLFDAMGPGCLYRQQMNIWMTAGNCLPDTKGVNIRYYFDGEKKPRIDMDSPRSSVRRTRWGSFASR